MAVKAGAFTPGATGNVSVSTIGFTPTLITLYVNQKNATDNVSHQSVGAIDGTNQWCQSFYGDTTGDKSVKSTSKCISQYERVSGTITEVVAATFVSFDANGFTLNFSGTQVTNYQVAFTAQS